MGVAKQGPLNVWRNGGRGSVMAVFGECASARSGVDCRRVTACGFDCKELLLCYGESIGTTGLFPPRKVVESRLGL